jgi:gliding motility-associated-like protein
MPPAFLQKVIFISLLLISGISNAQDVYYQWARNNGGAVTDLSMGSVTDISGNVYATGQFAGTVDMDPGPGVFMMTSQGILDIYIVKYDASGNFIWARQFGNANPGNEQVRDIAIDGSGNLYFTGFFYGTLDFDPGPGVFNVTCMGSGYAAYFLKLDNNGNFSWAKNIAQSDWGNMGMSIACASSGNLYVTGIFKGLTDLDPGPGTDMVNSINTAQDIFISKFDNSGNYLWSKQFFSSMAGYVYSIAVDLSENIYTTGLFVGTTDFDPGAATYNLTANSTESLSWMDAFITRLDANGNFVWARQLSGTRDDVGHGIDIDPSGNVIVTGFFEGQTDFDPGIGTLLINAGGMRKGFVIKLNVAGDLIWVRDFNGLGDCSSIPHSVATDVDGAIYTTGFFHGTIDFDGTGGGQHLTASGSGAFFISKVNADGSFAFAKQVENGQGTNGQSITVDALKNIYITGFFMGSMDFDPNAGVAITTTNGFSDAFVLKLSQCLQLTSETIAVAACGAYTINDQTYTTSGTYTQHLVNMYGCDSILTINLTLGGSQTTTDASSCDMYTWEGNTYSSSGIYTVTFTGSDGCDSIRRLNLVINNRVYTTIDLELCEGQSYQSYSSSGTYIDNYTGVNGCDSIRTLNLVIKPRSYYQFNTTICEGETYWGHSGSGVYNDTLVAANGCDSVRTLQLQVLPVRRTTVSATICQGENYFAGGASQTVPGIYRDTVVSSIGCDSIITTTLSVNPKPVPQLGPDSDICDGASLQLNPGSFSSYEWQDNSTAGSFTATMPGLYWVKVTNGFSCEATDSMEIMNIVPPPRHFLKPVDSVCQYEQLRLAPVGNYLNYQWSNGSTQTSISVSNAGQYTLVVQAQNGCYGGDTINVLPKTCPNGVFIPSAFTPNNDGRNDLFKALVYGKAVSFQLRVYNRWGVLVFMSVDPARGWNGKVKGDDTDSAVFVWTCSYQLEGGQPVFTKGTVMLVR